MRNALLAVILFFAISGCTAVTKSQKLIPDASQVKDVQILILFGGLPSDPNNFDMVQDFYRPQLKAALTERLPQIFNHNGIPVRSSVVESDPSRFQGAVQDMQQGAQASHLLIISPELISYNTRSGRIVRLAQVHFSAKLWDVQAKTYVWEAKPYISNVQQQPKLRTQHFAGQIINGLMDDKLVVLNQRYAVDLAGDRISDYYIGTKDR